MVPIESISIVQHNNLTPIFEVVERTLLLRMPTVLLVEDDDDLRCVMECTLRAMGCLVIACGNGHIASAEFRTRGRIDILLTDFEMPGMSGIELARELESICPGLPVMILTGAMLSAITRREMARRHWIYVRKPCDPFALASALKRLVNSKTDPLTK